MTLNNLIEKLTAGGQFKILNKGTDVEREVTGTYCCDLLSIAMSRAPEGCAWVTVMGNINTLAVAASLPSFVYTAIFAVLSHTVSRW